MARDRVTTRNITVRGISYKYRTVFKDGNPNGILVIREETSSSPRVKKILNDSDLPKAIYYGAKKGGILSPRSLAAYLLNLPKNDPLRRFGWKVK